MTSLWSDTAGPSEPKPPLPGNISVDVAIIGAGYTGLWTAYYLRDSGLRVAVIDSATVGFGASGRNGGWCSGLFPVSLTRLTRLHGSSAALAMQQALYDTVHEVGDVVALEGIDCDWTLGGNITLARTRRQLRAARQDPAFLPTDPDRCRASNVLGAFYTPHCAALHPLKLARGLAHSLARDLPVYEHTRALSISPGQVVTDKGTIKTDFLVPALEAYSASRTHAPTYLPPSDRRATLASAFPARPDDGRAAAPHSRPFAADARAVVPVYSLMLATEPLPAAVWDQIGLARRETFSDYRRLVIYGQRTADDRLAFGGRGAPYHFGSRIDPAFDLSPGVHAALHRALIDLFPQVADYRITHTWGGPLAIPRDWHPSVGLDPATRIAWAGGYVGDGVAAANLAGRTLADLILGRATALTSLPWVNHRSPRWEPEPLRWLGINTALRAVTTLDHLHP